MPTTFCLPTETAKVTENMSVMSRSMKSCLRLRGLISSMHLVNIHAQICGVKYADKCILSTLSACIYLRAVYQHIRKFTEVN